VKRAVEIESGVSIVPRNTVKQEVESGILAALEIEGPKMSRPLGILTKRNRARSPAHKEFVAALKREFAPLATVEVGANGAMDEENDG
jgi:DNA-binding transcriptional LysR family regulator